jgi:hypothetical protein
MRRVLLALFFVAAGFGIYIAPSGADAPLFSNVVLSFDFSDNSGHAVVSSEPQASQGSSYAPNSTSNPGSFNIISDVLPENTGGVVRMVAIPPASSGNSALVCGYQPVQQSQVECNFNFSTNGVWSIKAQYSVDTKSAISSVSVTSLRVSNS